VAQAVNATNVDAARRWRRPWCSTSSREPSRPCTATPRTTRPSWLAEHRHGEVHLHVTDQRSCQRCSPGRSRVASCPDRPSRPSPPPPSTTTSRRWPRSTTRRSAASPSNRSPRCPLQLRAQRPERTRGVRWRADRDPAGLVRHRLRQLGMALGAWRSPRRRSPSASTRFRRSICPVPTPPRSLRIPATIRGSTPTSRPRLLRVRAAERGGHGPADGPGGRRHRQPGGDHDTHVMRDIHDTAGNLLASTSRAVADRHQPPHRGRRDVADAGGRHQRNGDAGRVPGGVGRGGQDRHGRDRSVQPVDQRLDDRVRSGQQSQGAVAVVVPAQPVATPAPPLRAAMRRSSATPCGTREDADRPGGTVQYQQSEHRNRAIAGIGFDPHGSNETPRVFSERYELNHLIGGAAWPRCTAP